MFLDIWIILQVKGTEGAILTQSPCLATLQLNLEDLEEDPSGIMSQRVQYL